MIDLNDPYNGSLILPAMLHVEGDAYTYPMEVHDG
jgi:hypothetical protein